MKIKKIAATCKEMGICLLYDRVDAEGCVEQWIGNGAAMYPVRGMPYLEIDNVATMFELTAEQAEKMQMSKRPAPESIDLRDAAPNDVAIDQLGCAIKYGGREILPVKTAEGVVRFINSGFLAPAEISGGDPELWERRGPNGTPYIAVKRGLMLQAVVMPMDHMLDLAELLNEAAAGYVDIAR